MSAFLGNPQGCIGRGDEYCNSNYLSTCNNIQDVDMFCNGCLNGTEPVIVPLEHKCKSRLIYIAVPVNRRAAISYP